MWTAPPLSTWRMIAHLCRHDLRRFRLLIAAAIGLELLRAAYVEWSLQLAPTVIGDRFGGAGGEMETAFLDLAMWAMTWIATAVVVQADHPSDDRAFWRTRPLTPQALALGKIALLGLVFVAVPSILNAVRLAAHGAPGSAHVAAAVQIAVQAGGAVVPAWALAILTRTLPFFLAGTGGVVVGGYLVLMAGIWYMSLASSGIGSMSVGVGADVADWARSGTHGTLLGAAIVAIGFAILVAHYRVRRTSVALAAGAALVILPGFLPVPGETRPPAPAPELTRLLAEDPLRPAGVKVDSTFSDNGPRLAGLKGRLVLAGLPRDVTAGVIVDRVRVDVAGRDVAVAGLEQCCLGAGPIGVASRSEHPPTLSTGGPWADGLATVRGSAVPDLRAKPVTLDAAATVVFTRHRLVASIPLRPGAAFRGDGYAVEVLAIGDRLPALLLRFTHFPHLAGSDPELSFFTADATRTRVDAATTPFQWSARPARHTTFEWAQGRHWAMRLHAMAMVREDVGPDSRLLIVESRRAGQASARIAWAGYAADPR